MRILWLNANLLLPLDKGGKIRTWHLMRHLARRHEITYLTFANAVEADAHRPAMREVCAELVSVPWQDAAKGSLRFYAGVATHLVDPLPYAVAKYRSAAYRHAVDALLEHRGFDRMVCDFLVPAVNLRRTLPCPSILFTHNVEAEIWRRHAENATGRVSQALYRQQWRRMLRFEGRTLARFDRILAVSEADDQTFRRLYGDAPLPPIDVVATGVDTTFFTPTPEVVRPPEAPRLRRLDGLDAERGRRALLLPRRAAADPPRGARRHAVDHRPIADGGGETAGAGGGHRRHRHGRRRPRPSRSGVRDDRPAPRRRRHAPEDLRGDGRRQGRRLDHHRRRGLPTESGRHLLIADGAEAFADAVLRVVREPDLRRRLEREARTPRHPALRLVRGRGPARTQPHRRRRHRTPSTEPAFHPRRGRRTHASHEHFSVRSRLRRKRHGRGARRRWTHGHRRRRQRRQGGVAQRRAQPDRRARPARADRQERRRGAAVGDDRSGGGDRRAPSCR